MHYSSIESSVRVDFFKEKGKWYSTDALPWLYYNENDIHTTFLLSLHALLWLPERGRYRYSSMWAVCLSPYHENAHPLMRRLPDLGRFEVITEKEKG